MSPFHLCMYNAMMVACATLILSYTVTFCPRLAVVRFLMHWENQIKNIIQHKKKNVTLKAGCTCARISGLFMRNSHPGFQWVSLCSHIQPALTHSNGFLYVCGRVVSFSVWMSMAHAVLSPSSLSPCCCCWYSNWKPLIFAISYNYFCLCVLHPKVFPSCLPWRMPWRVGFSIMTSKKQLPGELSVQMSPV